MTPSSQITFRADASIEIGTGHVMRCLALAHALRAHDVVCRFLTRALPGHLQDRIADEGFEVVLLPAPHGKPPKGPPAHAHWAGVDWVQDAAETRGALIAMPSDWLVMDHYAFDARWQAAARPEGTKLMVIDDLVDRPHDCDLLLDQNFGRNASDYDGLVPDSCTRLTGPRYALLRPEFSEARASALSDRIGRGLKHLLITMGGIDRVDATSTVLNALRHASLPADLSITVIMGSKAPALNSVRALARAMPCPTNVMVDVSDMAERMAAADLAISAGGGTTWERCCLGLPSIIVETAENQAGMARTMARAGAGIDPGPLLAPEFAQNLQSALAEVSDPAHLDAMSEQAAAICDGDGVARVLAILSPAEVWLRAASRADARRVWEWRNTVDQTSRITRGDTPYQRHDAWFCHALNDPTRIIRTLLEGDFPCGYLRLDRDEELCARISICLSAEARGKGLAKELLKEADRLAVHFGIERLNAEIHPQNDVSRRAFKSAGYVQGNIVNGFLICHRTLKDAT